MLKRTETPKDKWDMTSYSCESCRFYVPKDEFIGRCRRHAPTLDGYPVVFPRADFCGDHKIGQNPLKTYPEVKK